MGKIKLKLKGKIKTKGENVQSTLSFDLEGNPTDIILALVNTCQEHPEFLNLMCVAIETYDMMHVLGLEGEKM